MTLLRRHLSQWCSMETLEAEGAPHSTEICKARGRAGVGRKNRLRICRSSGALHNRKPSAAAAMRWDGSSFVQRTSAHSILERHQVNEHSHRYKERLIEF